MDEDGETDESFEPAYETDRQTAPQTPYTLRDVWVGATIALVGLIITVGLPLVLG